MDLIFPSLLRASVRTESLGSFAGCGSGRAIMKLESAKVGKGQNLTKKRFANPPKGRGHKISREVLIFSKPARLNILSMSLGVSQFWSSNFVERFRFCAKSRGICHTWL